MKTFNGVQKTLMTLLTGLVTIMALFPRCGSSSPGSKTRRRCLPRRSDSSPRSGWFRIIRTFSAIRPSFSRCSSHSGRGIICGAELGRQRYGGIRLRQARISVQDVSVGLRHHHHVHSRHGDPADLFIVVNEMGMLDTLAVLVLPGIASAGHMFFIRQFYLNIPMALEEAALIDGAGRIKIFTHIFIPMSFPVFVIVGIGSYLAYWNSFVWPTMTVTNPELFQIMQYLYTFRSERATEMGMLMAGSALSCLPTIVLFLFFQKHIISGIKISGLK